jgi:hypothetical protein
MKIFAAVVALVAAIALPAVAEAAARKTHAKTTPQGQVQVQTPNEWSYAPPSSRPHSPNPAYDVYRMNGDYAGSDPDPRVRMMLRKDDTFNDQ